MIGYVGGAGSTGRLSVVATELAGATLLTDWLAVPPICPFNVGIGCSGAFHDASGFYTLQFRLEIGGAAFDHPYIVTIQTAAPDIAGNIAFPVQAIRFKYKYVTLAATLLIPGFQTISKAFP